MIPPRIHIEIEDLRLLMACAAPESNEQAAVISRVKYFLSEVDKYDQFREARRKRADEQDADFKKRVLSDGPGPMLEAFAKHEDELRLPYKD